MAEPTSNDQMETGTIADRPSRKVRIFNLAKLIALTGSAQVGVQAVGFISGILVIRLLTPAEYAYYVIANTVLGTMTILADGGVASGVMSQGAKVWQDRLKLGRVFATGIYLRSKFAVFSIVVSIPILIYLLLNNGADALTIGLICVTLVPAFYAGLWDSLLVIVPQLHQAVVPLQKNQLMVALGRMLLTGMSLFIFPWSYIALLASGIPRIIGNIFLKKENIKHADIRSSRDPEVQKAILGIVKRYMPGAVYFSLSGQITLWLISIFGNTTSVAQIGALGRFSMILALVNTLVATLITPRFARLSVNRNKLLLYYLSILAALMMFMLVIVGFTYLFPDQILWILGGEYSNLQFELVLCIIGSCMAVSSDIAFSLMASRGWMYNPLIYITVNVSAIIACAFTFDITTLKGALWMSIALSVCLYLMNILIFIRNNYRKTASV